MVGESGAGHDAQGQGHSGPLAPVHEQLERPAPEGILTPAAARGAEPVARRHEHAIAARQHHPAPGCAARFELDCAPEHVLSISGDTAAS